MEMDKKINRTLAETVLTVGCAYHPPKGGVAQVIFNYERYVFPLFKCVINSGGTNPIAKAWKAFKGILSIVIKLLCDKKIKIVHIHTASYNSFRRSAIFVKIAKSFHKKVVLHIHGGGFREYYATNPQKISSILNSCDCIITLTESWQTFFKQITTCQHVEVIENIVAPPQFKNIPKDGKLHLLFLGLISQQKGIYDLIEVIAGHKTEFDNKLILHIGGNGEKGKLIDLISKNNIANLITYEGWVSGDKKTDLLNIADAFILPSYTEGLPISILEAMSYGLPILSTPVGGIPEIVENGVNGFLFHPGDKNDIFQAILQLLSNKNLAKQMGDESLAKAKRYLPCNVSDALSKLYSSLID